jgi:asparagine synthase (glutamine-hydrolysing)
MVHFVAVVGAELPDSLVIADAVLVSQTCQSGDFWCRWWHYPHLPVVYKATTTEVAIVLGQAVGANLDFPADAEIFDGFHGAIAYSQTQGLRVSADLLGIFPIYYFHDSAGIIVASSPELIRQHPAYRGGLDVAGLVGILLSNGLLNGRTLWRGIRRLGAGYCLRWQGGQGQEVQQYHLPDFEQENPYKGITLPEQLELLDQTLSGTIARHLGAGKCTLLLSGGLDSRMLAGFLARQGTHPQTLTFGDRSDLEAQCAQAVAQKLGWPHNLAAPQFASYPDYAQQIISQEHLANGFNGVGIGWGINPALRQLPAPLVTGLCLDVALSGPLPVTSPGEELSFELFLRRRVNPWGIALDQLRRLLRPQLQETLTGTIAEAAQLYHSYGQSEYTRNLCFEYYHRERFHTGSRAWIFSFAAAPVMPVLDRQLLQLTALMPIWPIDRLAQQQLVITRFPDLADLPLDRNDFVLWPLDAARLRRRDRWRYHALGYWYRLQQRLGYDRRYYFRILDINNPGWQAIRRQAEPGRDRLGELFDLQVLTEILPPAFQPIKHRHDPIITSSGQKLLLGLLLWAQKYL